MSTTYDPSSVPNGFGYYDVPGVESGPLLISDEHAKELDATPHQPVEGKAGRPATIGEILDQVGEDPDLASAALAAEQASPSPRKSLVAKLEALAGASDGSEG